MVYLLHGAGGNENEWIQKGGVRNHPFQTNGKFDPELWKSLMYTQHIDKYKASKTIVPLYINSGDHDTFGIPLQFMNARIAGPR